MHQRIKRAENKNKRLREVANYLTGVRLFGNAGAHAGVDDAMVGEAFRFIEEALIELYDPRPNVKELAAKRAKQGPKAVTKERQRKKSLF